MVYLITIIVNEYLDINDIDRIFNAQNFWTLKLTTG